MMDMDPIDSIRDYLDRTLPVVPGKDSSRIQASSDYTHVAQPVFSPQSPSPVGRPVFADFGTPPDISEEEDFDDPPWWWIIVYY